MRPIPPFRSLPLIPFGVGVASALLLDALSGRLARAAALAKAPSSSEAAPEGGLPEWLKNLAFPPGTLELIIQTFTLLALGLVVLLVVNRWITNRADLPGNASLAKEVRALRQLKVGYPEGLTLLEALREQGLLEQRLAPLGLSIRWSSFPSASTLLSALSNGAIDFCGGGGTASIFSQAAEHLFVRVAKEKYPDITGEAILVPEDSPIQNLLDLQGKRIAFDEGSSAQFVLIRALAKVGLSIGDIEPVHLPQSEALPLFRRGQLDAWVIWMPYEPTEIRRTYPGRSIADLDGILGDRASDDVPTLYYSTPELVRDYPRVLKAVLEEVNEAGAQVNRTRLQTTKQLAERYELDPEIIGVLQQRSLERSIIPIDEQTLTALQEQANILRDLRLIPDRVNVRDGSYSLQTRQNWTY